MEGDIRISLRELIFREIIANLLIHREYRNAFPAKLIIERNRVYTENWNRPHDDGAIDPNNFTPYPKNPIIARFFKQIGWVDELGSGVRNTFKYCGKYTSGATPEFIEGDVFKTIIPIKPIGEVDTPSTKSALSWHYVGTKLALSKTDAEKILSFCKTPQGIQEIMDLLEWKDRTKFRNKYINSLLNEELLAMTEPDKIKSPNQAYYTTGLGTNLLSQED